ncbi:acetyl-CoA carboxylase biotin carboxyl carrier protein [uncultured Catenibacterium sp.]|uniref:acetyl-CoA carboxylase biotin carboxyl carrier protein n=1 Tax=uncultured Catenibacterium sp. TaxID=286142 RepID=UPI0025EC2C79|nr:acetyl-CoA carboxylase biotin carboxyl carrier protein [uncultured Catenibacterium sp.]
MDLVRELMEAFEQADIDKMKIEMEGVKLELEKSQQVQVTAPVTVSSESAPVVKEVKEEKTVISGTEVKAPLVGVYYSSPSPDDQPFVKEGSKVTKGQTLCIIEAMKVMNEIKAPVDGTVRSLLVKDEDLVSFDQTLMIIEE